MCISIRKVKEKDRIVLFNWFNKFDSLKYKIKTKNRISIEQHNKWFDERIIDAHTYMWIVEDKNNRAIGQIRFQKYDEKFYDIDIYIIENMRKKNLASNALILAMKVSKVKPLRAIVSKNNDISLKFFLKNRFKINLKNKSFIQLIRN